MISIILPGPAHTFKVFIKGKRKLSYRTDFPPPKGDPKLADWESEDSVVMAGCGIVSSLILPIQWNFVTLQRRFGILLANRSHSQNKVMFHINMSKSGKPLFEYYSSLKNL